MYSIAPFSVHSASIDIYVRYFIVYRMNVMYTTTLRAEVYVMALYLGTVYSDSACLKSNPRPCPSVLKVLILLKSNPRPCPSVLKVLNLLKSNPRSCPSVLKVLNLLKSKS